MATYFSKYGKIRYSFYMGLILAVLFSIVVTDNFYYMLNEIQVVLRDLKIMIKNGVFI